MPHKHVEFAEVINQAARTGETLTVTSAWGSTPFVPVRLVVLEPVAADGAYVVRKEGFEESSRYRVRNVLWLEDVSGARITCPQAQAYYDEIVAGRAQRATTLERLRSDPEQPVSSASVGIIQTLVGTLNGMPRTLYALKGNSSWGARGAVVLVADERSAKALCRTVVEHSGSTWDLLDIFLQAEFAWPVWIRMHGEAQAEGAVLRAGQPRLRDVEPNLDEDGFGSPKNFDRTSLYETAMKGPGAHYGSNDLARYFEADDIDYQVFFDLAKSVPPKVLGRYLTKAWDSNRLFAAQDTFDASDLRVLAAAGLVVPAREASLESVLTTLPAKALWAPLKARKMKFVQMGKHVYQKFYAANMTPEFESELRASPQLEDKWMFVPPNAWTWEQLQDFRYCYHLMVTHFLSWVGGAPVSPSVEPYFKALA